MSNFWEWQIWIWPIFQKFKKWNCKLKFPQLVKTINALIRHIFWTLWIGTWELLWETANISILDAFKQTILAQKIGIFAWFNLITIFLFLTQRKCCSAQRFLQNDWWQKWVQIKSQLMKQSLWQQEIYKYIDKIQCTPLNSSLSTIH